MTTTEGRNRPDYLAAGASLVVLLGFLGAVGYACIAPAYHSFYSQLGLRPADVGQERVSMLIYPAYLVMVLVASATIFSLAAGVSAVVVWRLWPDWAKTVLGNDRFRRQLAGTLLPGHFLFVYVLIDRVVENQGLPGVVGWAAGVFAMTPVCAACASFWRLTRKGRLTVFVVATVVGIGVTIASSLSLASAAQRAGEALLQSGSCQSVDEAEVLRLTGMVEGGDIGLFIEAVEPDADPLRLDGRRVLTLGGNSGGEWVVVPDLEACDQNETPRPAVFFASQDRYLITRSADIDQPWSPRGKLEERSSDD